MASDADTAATIRTFRAVFDPAFFDDLRARLADARWPEAETDGAQGLPLARARVLIDYWRRDYDFGRLERRLNRWPQFVTQVDGLDIHFLHIRSPNPCAIPLILTHGWPGSVIEFLEVLEALSDPARHGGSDGDAFHLVVPTLPGYGLSGKPSEPGWGLPRIARAWGTLMQRLGYRRYVAQGGDWGAGVTTRMAVQRVPGLLGIHLNLPILFPPPPSGPAGYTAEEQPALAQLQRIGASGLGYAQMQATRPQTIGYGLADSPTGLATWIYEKFTLWSDAKRPPEASIGIDALLDNIMLYWLTNSAASSARLYRESFFTDFTRTAVDLPVAVSIFTGDIFTPPRVWGERTYPNLIYWNEVPAGGHFAAFEQPGLFIAELRAAFRDFRRQFVLESSDFPLTKEAI